MEEITSLLEDPYNYSQKISVRKLEKLLRKLSFIYYNTGKSVVPDEIFDIAKNVLEERNPNNLFLQEIGAPISKDKIKLPYEMHSLDKIKPSTDTLDSWKEDYHGPYVLSDKLDGVSALMVFKGDKIQLFTRGDGKKGQNISFLISYVMPNDFEYKQIPKGLAVRGELIISKKNFNKMNISLKRKKKKELKNARNTAAGLVNSKTISKRLHLAEITDFIAYSVVNPRYSHDKQLKKLIKLGFPTVKHKQVNDMTNDDLSDYLEKRRERGKYEVDGIVVNDCSKSYPVGTKNPDHAFAFKTILKDQVAESTVVDVLWDVSKDGYIKPRVQINPVDLVGVTVTYATAFNAKFVVDNVLGPGALIEIIRSGDVIPYINKILKPAATGEPKLPDIPHKWNKTNVDFVVQDIHGAQSDSIIIKKMDHFFKTLGIKNISIGVITKLVNNDFNSIESIIDMDIEEVSEIDGIGKKLANKILKNIRQVLAATDLVTFMAASNTLGRGLGKRKLKLILEEYPYVLSKDWDEETMIEKIEDIHGFDTITATLFAENLNNFKDFFDNINDVIDISHLKKHKVNKSKGKRLFKGEKVVMTGFRSKDIEKFIEDNGGKISSGVSSNTTLLIYTEGKEGSKYKKAKELKIKTITRHDFELKYMKN